MFDNNLKNSNHIFHEKNLTTLSTICENSTLLIICFVYLTCY